MKIQCDVCNREEATVFCSSDEAALCDGCDSRVHHANKLASKHIRFSLQLPSFKDCPRCDICQERRAFLFCQEDRAILCRECDIPIHKANEHTQKHNRFLLTGVKLSASSSSSSLPALSSSSGCDLAAADSGIQTYVSNQYSDVPSSNDHKTLLDSTSTHCRVGEDDHCTKQENTTSTTSTITEYLMETLPGWGVDDFLDPSSSTHGFCKFLDYDDFEREMYPFASEDLAISVPEDPIQAPYHIPLYLPQTGVINGLLPKGTEKTMKKSKKWSEAGFLVPQISPILKKSRQSCRNI